MNAVDTNVFVYSLSVDEPIREPIATPLLDTLSSSDTVLLWQVACEFGAAIARLHRQGRVSLEAFEAVAALRDRFPLVLPNPQVLEMGWKLYREHLVSYWDALLLAACLDAGITRLYSEDMASSLRVNGLEIANPFAP